MDPHHDRPLRQARRAVTIAAAAAVWITITILLVGMFSDRRKDGPTKTVVVQTTVTPDDSADYPDPTVEPLLAR